MKKGSMGAITVNINVRHRLTQIIVFVACILGCILISQFAEAGRSPKPPRFDKPKYRVSVHSNSNRVVKVLYKKRMGAIKSSAVASNRKGRKQVQAETDTAY